MEIQLVVTEHKLAKRIANIVIADVQRLEGLYSWYKPDSPLSSINKVAATSGRITVDEETAELLNYAATCYQQSDGLSISVQEFCVGPGVSKQAGCRTID